MPKAHIAFGKASYKTDCHDITEILLKVVLKHHKPYMHQLSMTHPQNNLFQAKNKNYVVFSKHLISGRGYTVSFDDLILIYIGITVINDNYI